MSIATQFYLLQYKNWKLQLRKKLVTALEFGIPVVLCIVMVLIRSIVQVTEYPDPTYFPSYPIDELPSELVSVMSPKIKTVGLAYTPQTNVTTEIINGIYGHLRNQYVGPSLICE